jgi:serine/threonine protein kinase
MPILYRPGAKVDRYTIVRSLGQGAASRSYLAQDVVSQQEVVLKFPLDDLVGGAAIFARYTREREIGQRLTHPSIQRHVNQGEPRQAEYLALEYLPGRTLREAMHEQALSQEEALTIVQSVCEALVYAHEHGVIHRDIKPDNILLLTNGEVRIIDFGIALLKTEPRRRRPFAMLSDPIGTPGYMSPERLRGEAGDERADIYAVGAMLYELLCGRTPFEDLDGFAIVNQQSAYDPPSILQLRPDLSPALATIVMRSIRRDPQKRYQTMQDLLDDLRHPDNVTPQDYYPDPPLLGGRYRQALLLLCIVFLICLAIIAFGMLAQLAHHAIR